MDANNEGTERLMRPWDTFREVPVIEDTQTPWKYIKLFRIFALVAVALFVFGLAVCSKASFLLLVTLSHDGSKTLPAEMKPLALLCIGCSIVTPSVLLCLKSIWKACYKSSKFPQKSTVALVLFFEVIIAASIAILTIVAMPHLDIVTNVAILNGVALISAFLQGVAHCSAKAQELSRFLVPCIFAFLFILLGYVLFLALYIMKDPNNVRTMLWVGLAAGASILVSFNWWENYFRLFAGKKSPGFLDRMLADITNCQNMLHIFSSLVRIAVTAAVLGAYVPLAQMDWTTVTFSLSEESRILAIVIGTQLVSSALCYWFSLMACKMHAVRRCFVLPLYMASLAVLAVFIAPVVIYYVDFREGAQEGINFTSYCAIIEGQNQSLNGSVFPHLVWDVSGTLCLLDLSSNLDIGILSGSAASWWLGLILATVHIWNLKLLRIQKTQDLFTRRLYEGVFIEQSLLLNTRFTVPTGEKKQPITNPGSAEIYLCATMWHETNSEMRNIIISIFRLDKARPKLEPVPEDLDFSFESHIFFDDAFEQVEGSPERQLNEYATNLVKVITEVYGIFRNIDKTFFDMQQQIPNQKVTKTPYGGRLVVTMPCGNQIVVHFKDKDLIRHKKRWSQVMYLYYLLGWKLNSKYSKLLKKESRDKVKKDLELKKKNTYLLALDGDTDFQPAAVMLLVDRLKMYPRVGAACGRIHPTGSGPAVWFQKFEYAASHWLQKTAEHVFGSVLCSPGCFSLFRAEALMDDNVMRSYATKSTEASHYIQYDQGEDRWLCTLMLKQGWRVEYNAASDAYTNAPEDFKELYNQRRRWGPSTMANVVDLLGSSTFISKKNTSISKPFMFYQLFAIISAILAPATICLMVAGSLSFMFNIHSAAALVLALIPPVIFLVLCFKLKPDTQITVAAILSVMYAFLMLAVTMSIIGSMVKEKTILTPSSVFILAMSAIYVVTALMHPQELPILFYGVLYIICIPSAYLLLTIYSMANMNVVSWGTRETKPAADSPPASQKTPRKKDKNQLQKLWSKIKCCRKSKDDSVAHERDVEQDRVPELEQQGPRPQNSVVDEEPPMERREAETMVIDIPPRGWVPQLQNLTLDMRLDEDHLEEEEVDFWKELLERYLHPLPNDKERQKQMHEDLRSLRNKINFCFFFLNALWLVSTFIFQVFEVFKIQLDLVGLDMKETGGKFEVDPVGLMFILGFALSVLLQFVGMLYHRINTLIHYVAFLGTEGKHQDQKKKKVSAAAAAADDDDDDDDDDDVDSAATTDDGNSDVSSTTTQDSVLSLTFGSQRSWRV